MDIFECLVKNGYKEFTNSIHDNSRNFQKRVESSRVCSCNEKLFINIFVYDFEVGNNNFNSCKASITAEFYDVWWDISCYSLPKEYVIKNLDSIERRLITMFNCIPE